MREVLYILKIPNGTHCISIHGIQCECFHQAQIFRFCKMLSNNDQEKIMMNELHAVCPEYD